MKRRPCTVLPLQPLSRGTLSRGASWLLLLIVVAACGGSPPASATADGAAEPSAAARAERDAERRSILGPIGMGDAKGGDALEGGRAPAGAPHAAGAARGGTIPGDIHAHQGKVEPAAPAADNSGGPVPVSSRDPQLGDADALVTWVVFSDMQCPFCRRLDPTVQALARRYGPRKLRVVWKHQPLEFHPRARAAAEAGVIVHRARGNGAFFSYTKQAFEALHEGRALSDALRAVGMSPRKVQAKIDAGDAARKVEADMRLAFTIGASGTPASFINGKRIEGAMPEKVFAALIDKQLREAQQAHGGASGGKPLAGKALYRELSARNYKPPKPASLDDDTITVWTVPIGDSPVLGRADAPVTVVIFSDFECPFCSRANESLEALREKYGNKLRFAFKHHPLPFHKRAGPAAQLAEEARRRKGDAAFWKAHDWLFANQDSLDDDGLKRAASSLGLSAPLAMQAVRSSRYQKRIERDLDLADDLSVRGTPQFFINGRRLVGAQPADAFGAIIDEELGKVAELRKKGIAAGAVYAELQKGATPLPQPSKISLPRDTQRRARKGPKSAKVTIDIFSDFQCPFCKRALPALEEVEKNYRGRVALVFHHLPLSFHKDARPAAIAAHEVLLQRGDAAFWKLHDLLFDDPANLSRQNVIDLAAKVGADRTRVAKAIDTAKHDAVVGADVKLAGDHDINGTPTFVINGYVLEGAQPYRRFRRIIDRALSEP
jgi:protein-disulfide isomerase